MIIPDNIFIALIGTGIVALIINGYKQIRKVLIRRNINKTTRTVNKMLIYHIKSVCDDNMIDVVDDFASLIFHSYTDYLFKMASTISEKNIYYDIDVEDDAIYVIEGVTRESTKYKIRELIKKEIDISISLKPEYHFFLGYNRDEFRKHTDSIIKLMEQDIDIQIMCADIVIQSLKLK